MMKTIGIAIKGLGVGLLLHTLISGPAEAEAACPGFNAAMVDTAAMAADLLGDVVPSDSNTDDPSVPVVLCSLRVAGGEFVVDVNFEAPDEAEVRGQNTNPLDGDRTFVRSVAEDLSQGELFACRAEVLRSHVWEQHCAPSIR
jgi:ABC-type sugar transport system substrate-binding protein